MSHEPLTPLTAAAAAHQQDRLDRAAQLAHEASFEAREAMHGARKIAGSTAIADAAKRAAEATWDCLQLILRCGANPPVTPSRRAADALDLSALTMIADPDAPELLALLEQAQAVAERIDLRRGRAVAADIPLAPGESRGTDLAESISEIALRVRIDVHGPTGRD